MRSQHWWILSLLVSGLLVVAATGDDPPPGKKADGPLDRKALDATVHKTFRFIINKGADLYNNGDTAGCYRLYQGALLAIQPLLGADLQQEIGAAIKEAEQTTLPYERAFVLRRVIDRVRAAATPEVGKADEKPRPKPPTPAPAAKTLWDRLGGDKNVSKVVDDFVGAAAADPKVDFFRSGKYKPDADGVAKLKRLLVEQISSVSGGPLRYTGRDMKSVHAGMGITDAQFDALAGHLKLALELNGARPEDVTTVLGVVGGMRKEIVEPKKSEPKKEEPKKEEKKPEPKKEEKKAEPKKEEPRKEEKKVEPKKADKKT